MSYIHAMTPQQDQTELDLACACPLPDNPASTELQDLSEEITSNECTVRSADPRKKIFDLPKELKLDIIDFALQTLFPDDPQLAHLECSDLIGWLGHIKTSLKVIDPAFGKSYCLSWLLSRIEWLSLHLIKLDKDKRIEARLRKSWKKTANQALQLKQAVEEAIDADKNLISAALSVVLPSATVLEWLLQYAEDLQRAQAVEGVPFGARMQIDGWVEWCTYLAKWQLAVD